MQEYGKGAGYRNRVTERLREWFEAQPQTHLHENLEAKVQRAWIDKVIGPLSRFLGLEDGDLSLPS